jgi:citrate lyase subunit beta / citryl-CoA lyase
MPGGFFTYPAATAYCSLTIQHRADETTVRSLLFVPGDSDRKIGKAMQAGADAVILDLEDSVSPDNKAQARSLVRKCLASERSCKVGVRVNGMDTGWYLDDLAGVCAAAPDFIMLPKCETLSDVRVLAHQLAVLEPANGLPRGRIKILPLVTETAAALQKLDYRGAPDRLEALCFAGEDLSADLGVSARGSDGRFNPLLEQARMSVAVAASAAGVPCIDTPFPDPRDEIGLLAEAGEAVALGYSGKLCIHPVQIQPIGKAFQPDEEQVGWAKAVVSAFERAPSTGVALLNGKMIDKAHLRLAQRCLNRSGVDGTAVNG